MPQHPDSYELSPHWNMVGEHGFHGEVIPHPTHLIQPEPEVPDICSQMEQIGLPEEEEELWSSQMTITGSGGKVHPIRSGPLADEILLAIVAAEHHPFGSWTRIWRDGQNWEVWKSYDNFGRRIVNVAKCGPGGKVYTITLC